MTPTHTSRVEVPSKIPHTSYDDKSYITRKFISLLTGNGEFYGHQGDHTLCYLGLNPDFDEAADDGEHVAHDEQNIPAVDELHPVSPAHTATQFVFEVLHVLLGKETGDNRLNAT